jgi:hypothetical protein
MHAESKRARWILYKTRLVNIIGATQRVTLALTIAHPAAEITWFGVELPDC